ncbi:MAG: phosphatidylserine decarboxylase family protein [Bacteroidetes bacterium]|nr:phosphatidylserine decarboxylase family protein [Bacteroidota bacterium]MCH7770884.1 phosphatidylserine decarboxylase family protein [Bacteroidota bacterium]
MFTKYGYSTIGIVSIISFLLIVLGIFLNNNIARISLFVLAFILISFTLYFFRDPDRIPPAKENIVVSPADGRVLFVKEVIDNKFINDKANQISIFMSPLNVHVNRIPISGTVEYFDYIEGRYVAAFEDKASELNERTEIGITNKNGKIFFTQVAGFVARRIVNELNMGEDVKIGERFGMIKFGSRVDVVAPLNWKPNVKKDESVTAGETILFELVE